MKPTAAKIATAGLIFGLALAFQNCAKPQFTSEDGSIVNKLSTDESLVSVEETENGDASESDDIGMDDVEVVADGKKDPKEGGKDSDKDKDCDHKYVCVVEGAGHSMKIAYVNGQLLAKVGTPSDVCMTQEACTQIIGKVMTVKGAFRRGFCPDKNPHVVNFTNARVQELVNQLKK